MKHLEKITISNIRRFGENVEINIGKGATIFLAPNGTGKTAIFEAIELALTGKVKRLIFPPEPLIRDNQAEAFIKLDFGDGKYCQATFKKGSDPVLNGSHHELFGKAEEQDLPFLLQLTHFLNQQGNNWFVNSHGPDAGSQLDHLSIGREATEVNQLIPSAKRAAGNELSVAQREFDEIEEKWKQWLQLLDRRKQTNVGLINELVGRDILLNQMNSIAVRFKDFTIEKEANLFALKILNAELLSVCHSLLDSLKKQSIELRSFYSLIPEFNNLNLNLAESKSKLSSQQKLLKDKEIEIEGLIKTLNEHIALLATKQAAVVSMQDSKKHFSEQQLLNTQISAFEIKVRNISQKLEQLTKDGDLAKVDLQNAQSNISLHQLLQKRTENINNEYRRIEELKIVLQKWLGNNDLANKLLNVRIPAIKLEILKLSDLKLNAEKLEAIAKDNLEKSQIGFNALNQTVDIIKTAVGTILSEYPKDRGDCPVCGTEFQPDELQLKMTETARVIHPGLKALSDLIEQNRESARTAALQTKSVQNELQNKQAELEVLDTEVNKLTAEVNVLRNLNFNSCDTVQEANTLIQKLEKENNDASSNLNNDKLQAPIAVSQDQVLLYNAKIVNTSAEVQKNTEELHKISVDINSLRSSLQSVIKRIDNNLSIDQISENIKKAEEELTQLENKINELKNTLDSQYLTTNSLKDQIIREEISVSRLTTRISEHRTRWNDAKLISDPNQEALNQAIENLETRMVNGEKYIAELEIVNREITRWQVVEDDLKVEEEIKVWRGNKDETIFNIELEKEVNVKREKLKLISQNTEILSVFSECLSRELDAVHEKIVSINPLWKKLLKRIIIDPRFSHTQLDSFSYYKKQHANVNVKLHGADVLVSQVASEAQITDLQLTFMLAMAQKYQWTSWKSLLLDDPTQHHDLVHASAVFDLLRDYISDFDFQILMATHDPVQARFFMRKLENDGIPVNICTLFATEDGVKARIGS